MQSLLKILFQDEHLVAIHKPSGFHVHPHENPDHRISRDRICLYVLRNQIRQYVYPIHRLDAGTSGVLLFAKSGEVAGLVSKQFQNKDANSKSDDKTMSEPLGKSLENADAAIDDFTIRKIYHAVVRGYVADQGTIDLPLESDSSDLMLSAQTKFKTLAQVELPYAVGKRHPTARYSLVEVSPLTGRYHQIRRHFNQIFHPILGDSTHGDSYHNRFFRQTLGIAGLCLRASSLQFRHPISHEILTLNADKRPIKANSSTSPITEKMENFEDLTRWQKISELFNYQPL
jgi:tRNA pseudouridine65 synthase